MNLEEFPPPPTPELQQWAEDLSDYLRRTIAEIDRQLEAIDARLTALEP